MSALAGLSGPRRSGVVAGMERGQGFDGVQAGLRSADVTVGGPGGRGPLVVVAGLPGAGKSTALEELQARGAARGLLVLDSAAVRGWLQSRLARIPYPVLGPVVHAAHWVRGLTLALTECRPLVVHETATRPGSRRAAVRALPQRLSRP